MCLTPNDMCFGSSLRTQLHCKTVVKIDLKNLKNAQVPHCEQTHSAQLMLWPLSPSLFGEFERL